MRAVTTNALIQTVNKWLLKNSSQCRGELMSLGAERPKLASDPVAQ